MSIQNDFRILQNIIRYCEDIESARKTFGDDEGDFADNKHYQFSCAFCIGQIGEALKRLSNDVRAMHATDWKGISGFRNVIAHEYGNVTVDFLWTVVTERIPLLKGDCMRMFVELTEKHPDEYGEWKSER